MFIDAHVHFWEYDEERDGWMENMPALQQDRLPADIQTILQSEGVTGCIAVQAAQSEEETFFLMKLAEQHDFIKGVVGWTDLQSRDVEERLAYFSQQPVVRGWRHILQAEPVDFLSAKKFRNGIRALKQYNYVYDILIREQQLGAAVDLVNAFPEQVFVLDHCGKPNIMNGAIKNWADDLKEISRHPNVYCKLSGLLTEADCQSWQPSHILPYLDVVFETFGTGRILYGSDWPVLNVAGDYHDWKKIVSEYLLQFSREDQEKIMGLNAVKVYSLSSQ